MFSNLVGDAVDCYFSSSGKDCEFFGPIFLILRNLAVSVAVEEMTQHVDSLRVIDEHAAGDTRLALPWAVAVTRIEERHDMTAAPDDGTATRTAGRRQIVMHELGSRKIGRQKEEIGEAGDSADMEFRGCSVTLDGAANDAFHWITGRRNNGARRKRLQFVESRKL